MQNNDHNPANETETIFNYFNEIAIIASLSSNLFERNLPSGMTQSQFGVLNWFVRVDVEATPGRLAKAFEVTAGAMTNTLKKLADKGYIVIRPNPLSGRQKQVTITPAGLEARSKAIASAGELFEEFARTFPPEALQEQLHQLQDIRRYLDDFRQRK